MKKRYICMILFLLVLPNLLSAQIEESLPCLNKTLSITAHIVIGEDGDTGISQNKILKNVELMNEAFDTICLQFEVCTFKYINNYQYNILDNYKDTMFKEWVYPQDWFYPVENQDMFSKYMVPKTINIYFVDSVYSPAHQKWVGGYAFMPGGLDAIVLKKKSAEKTYIHEMGHFFGLAHTFEDANGEELVRRDTLNEFGVPLCELLGDKLCDTDADIEGGNINAECQLTDGTKDAAGTYYLPPTDNYMSYHPDECKCRFTPGQYRIMVETYLNQRNYLW